MIRSMCSEICNGLGFTGWCIDAVDLLLFRDRFFSCVKGQGRGCIFLFHIMSHPTMAVLHCNIFENKANADNMEGFLTVAEG